MFFNLGLALTVAPAEAKEVEQLDSKFDSSWVTAAPVGTDGEGASLAIAPEPAAFEQNLSKGIAELSTHRFLEVAQTSTPEAPANTPSTLPSDAPQAPAQSLPDGVEPTAPAQSQPDVVVPQEQVPTQPDSEEPQASNPLAPPPGWRFDFEPYLYLPFKVRGDIFFGRGRPPFFPSRPGQPEFPSNPEDVTRDTGLNLSVDASLSDILNNLTSFFWLSGRFQAWNGNFGIIVDGFYTNTQFSNRSDGGTITLRDRFDIPVPGFRVDTQTVLTSVALGGSYRFGPFSLRGNSDPANPRSYYPAISLEALAGARYVSAIQRVDFSRGPELEVSGNELLPLLGGGVNLLFSDSFGVFFRADAAALLDGNLKQFYNLYFGIDWRLSRSWALRLAYRINQIEFAREGRLGGNNGFDLRSEGVQFGVSWQF